MIVVGLAASSPVIWSRDPYLYGVASPFTDPETYAQMVRDWPADMAFQQMGAGYRKSSLSERYAVGGYFKVIERPTWAALHAMVKSETFREHWLWRVREQGADVPDVKTSARFEFSSLPAEGGYLAPHRDTPQKLLTLVVPIIDPDEAWDPNWGGGTALLKPKDSFLSRHLQDYRADWDAFDVIADVPYQANQALVFIRSEISWHGVQPLTGPNGKERRSLTINIEAVR